MIRIAAATALLVSAVFTSTAKADEHRSGLDWTGFYFGAHVGKLYGDTDNISTPVIPGFQLPDGKANNWFGGIQGGYRYQFPNNFVVGASLRAPLAGEQADVVTFGNINTVEMRGSITGALSLGYAFDRFLPYISVGYGFAFMEAREVLANGIASPWVENTHSLVTLGVGLNYAVTDNWSVGVAYNRIDASRERYDCGPRVCGIVGSFDFTGDSVTGSVEYRF